MELLNRRFRCLDKTSRVRRLFGVIFRFLSLFCDAHCIGSFEFCALGVAVAFFEKNKKCMCDLAGPTPGKEKDPPMHQLLYRLLERPISRVVFYRDMLTKLAECYPSFVNEHGIIMAAHEKWENFWAYILEQRKQAEATRLYWDNTAIKISVSPYSIIT